MNLLLILMVIQMYSSSELTTSAQLDGATTKKPHCLSEQLIRSREDKITQGHLILGPPDSTGDHAPCYNDRTCAQVVCPMSISTSAEFFATTAPLLENVGDSRRQVYLNISVNGVVRVCAHAFVLYAEARFSGDFEFAVRMCQDCFEGSQTATIEMRGKPLPAKDPATRKFYFSAASIDDFTGSFSGVYTSNRAANVSQPLATVEFAKSILSGAEDTGFSLCEGQ